MKQIHQDDSFTLHHRTMWIEISKLQLSPNSNFIDFAYCQGGKTISYTWRFDEPPYSSCGFVLNVEA